MTDTGGVGEFGLNAPGGGAGVADWSATGSSARAGLVG